MWKIERSPIQEEIQKWMREAQEKSDEIYQALTEASIFGHRIVKKDRDPQIGNLGYAIESIKNVSCRSDTTFDCSSILHLTASAQGHFHQARITAHTHNSIRSIPCSS